MSNEQKRNEIDEIFRKAIDSVETIPSEEFWRKAAEDVISRGSKLNQRNTFRWKAIAFILAAGLLMLGYYTVSGLKRIEKQITTSKKIQNQSLKREDPAVNNATKIIPDNAIVMNANSNAYNKAKDINSSKENNSKPSAKTARSAIIAAEVPGNRLNKLQASGLNFNNPLHSGAQQQKAIELVARNGNDKIVSDNQPPLISKSTVQENLTDNATNNPNLTESPWTATKAIETNSISTAQQASPTAPKADKQTIALALNDTTKAVSHNDSLVSSNSSRFSVSAFFSPDFMLGYKFKSTGSWGSQLENIIKTDEKQRFSYTAGAKAGYLLSPHFSISAGIAYQVFSFNINPGVIYAQKQPDGDIGYYITTSSGTVECPYYGTPKAGDSLKMSASSSRSYLEIPVGMKCSFIDKTKYSFYVSGAVEANISLEQRTAMNWQGVGYESGQATVNSTQGSASMYFSYYIGIGAGYKIGKSLSIYIEPGLNDAITSLDKNVSAISYPRLFSITSGLTYYIK